MLGVIKRQIFRALISCLCISCMAHAAVNDSAIKITWGYTGNIGPARWGQLDPSFATCVQGKLQSPINISKYKRATASTLEIHYAPSPLDIVNDGTTNLLLANQQLLIDDGHGMQVNFPVNSNEFISLIGSNYHLIQFHIHTPSENQLQGQNFPLEIQFVHQGENGKIIIMSVFGKGGTENAELQKIINHLPNDKTKEHVISDQTINPAALLPAKQNYYSFKGSLTTPPCLEGVEWLVMDNPITVSPAQFTRLKRAVGGANARPVQALHKRQILYYTVQ